MSHRQVLVKVNAPVDEGIAEVVSALNEFPGLYTTQSCQGREDGYAFVWFRYGEDAHEAADFVVWLSKELGVLGVRLLAEWAGGSALRVELRVEPPAVRELAARLRDLSHAARTSASPCGTARTGSGSS